MSIKRIYNPRHVYEGWFESYFIKPWIDNYVNFRGGESPHSLVMSLVGWFVVTLGVAGLLMGLVGLAGPDVGFLSLKIVGTLWLLLSVPPFAALVTRGINGPAPESRNRKFLAIDVLLMGACILFFVFGLLMMTTTLNSEILRPDPGTEEVMDTDAMKDTVYEEPIFTYQTPKEEVPPVDTLQELTEPDMVDIDESFDPTLETDVNVAAPAQPDSIYF